MIVNRDTLFAAAPIKDMYRDKRSNGDTSYGMSEAGYDIRIKQEVRFSRHLRARVVHITEPNGDYAHEFGRFALASSIEEFQMPPNLVGIVHDKSTWARRKLSVFNTVIEPSWKGFLTLELVYHGDTELVIPAGSGIAQVIFHQTTDDAHYTGKYQNQPDKPVGPRSR